MIPGILSMAPHLTWTWVVIADEILGMARRLTKGIKVDEETFGFDVIEKVGPGGRFGEEEHTKTYGRKLCSRLINRAAREIFEKPAERH